MWSSNDHHGANHADVTGSRGYHADQMDSSTILLSSDTESDSSSGVEVICVCPPPAASTAATATSSTASTADAAAEASSSSTAASTTTTTAQRPDPVASFSTTIHTNDRGSGPPPSSSPHHYQTTTTPSSTQQKITTTKFMIRGPMDDKEEDKKNQMNNNQNGTTTTTSSRRRRSRNNSWSSNNGTTPVVVVHRGHYAVKKDPPSSPGGHRWKNDNNKEMEPRDDDNDDSDDDNNNEEEEEDRKPAARNRNNIASSSTRLGNNNQRKQWIDLFHSLSSSSCSSSSSSSSKNDDVDMGNSTSTRRNDNPFVKQSYYIHDNVIIMTTDDDDDDDDDDHHHQHDNDNNNKAESIRGGRSNDTINNHKNDTGHHHDNDDSDNNNNNKYDDNARNIVYLTDDSSGQEDDDDSDDDDDNDVVMEKNLIPSSLMNNTRYGSSNDHAIDLSQYTDDNDDKQDNNEINNDDDKEQDDSMDNDDDNNNGDHDMKDHVHDSSLSLDSSNDEMAVRYDDQCGSSNRRSIIVQSTGLLDTSGSSGSSSSSSTHSNGKIMVSIQNKETVNSHPTTTGNHMLTMDVNMNDSNENDHNGEMHTKQPTLTQKEATEGHSLLPVPPMGESTIPNKANNTIIDPQQQYFDSSDDEMAIQYDRMRVNNKDRNHIEQSEMTTMTINENLTKQPTVVITQAPYIYGSSHDKINETTIHPPVPSNASIATEQTRCITQTKISVPTTSNRSLANVSPNLSTPSLGLDNNQLINDDNIIHDPNTGIPPPQEEWIQSSHAIHEKKKKKKQIGRSTANVSPIVSASSSSSGIDPLDEQSMQEDIHYDANLPLELNHSTLVIQEKKTTEGECPLPAATTFPIPNSLSGMNPLDKQSMQEGCVNPNVSHELNQSTDGIHQNKKKDIKTSANLEQSKSRPDENRNPSNLLLKSFEQRQQIKGKKHRKERKQIKQEEKQPIQEEKVVKNTKSNKNLSRQQKRTSNDHVYATNTEYRTCYLVDENPDLPCSLQQVDFMYRKEFDENGYPIVFFTVYADCDDYLYHFKLFVAPSKIQNAGLGAFIMYLGSSLLLPEARVRRNRLFEFCMFYEPKTMTPLDAILPKVDPEHIPFFHRQAVSVVLTGNNLHGNNNNVYWSYSDCLLDAKFDKKRSRSKFNRRTMKVRLVGNSICNDNDEIEVLRKKKNRIGYLGIDGVEDYEDGGSKAFDILNNCIDLGRYGPFRNKDRKPEPLFILKSFILSNAPSEWPFDVEEKYSIDSSHLQIIDITSDITGEPLEMAKSNINMYVNEAVCSDRHKQNVYVKEKNDRTVHYFLKLNHPLPKKGCVELLTNYKNSYQSIRERKGYGYKSIYDGLQADDHYPSRMERSISDREDALAVIQGVQSLSELTKLLCYIAENTALPLEAHIRKTFDTIMNSPVTELSSIQWVAARRIQWLWPSCRSRYYELLRLEDDHSRKSLAMYVPLMRYALDGMKCPSLDLSLMLKGNLTSKSGESLRTMIRRELTEEICFVVRRNVPKPFNQRVWCPVAQRLLCSLCDQICTLLLASNDADENSARLWEFFLERAAESAYVVRQCASHVSNDEIGDLVFDSGFSIKTYLAGSLKGAMKFADMYGDVCLKNSTIPKGFLAALFEKVTYLDALSAGSMDQPSDTPIRFDVSDRCVMVEAFGCSPRDDLRALASAPRAVLRARNTDQKINQTWYLVHQIAYPMHFLASTFISDQYDMEVMCEKIRINPSLLVFAIQRGIQGCPYKDLRKYCREEVEPPPIGHTIVRNKRKRTTRVKQGTISVKLEINNTEASLATNLKSSVRIPAMQIYEGPPTRSLDYPGGWPEGWIQQTYKRMSGASVGQTDDYWFTPNSKHRLRSIQDVKAFLQRLARYEGDEIKALVGFKSK